MRKNFFLPLLMIAINVPQARATLFTVPSSDLTGTEICKLGFNPPQCKAAFFSNDQNVAYQSNGFAQPAVAKDNIHGYDSIHQPEFVNDGAYGNGTSWISDSPYSWIKIDLG